jgi:ABC-type sulfate transport system substrate-binding protein
VFIAARELTQIAIIAVGKLNKHIGTALAVEKNFSFMILMMCLSNGRRRIVDQWGTQSYQCRIPTIVATPPITKLAVIEEKRAEPQSESAYVRYLQSPRWRTLARAVRMRAKGKCEICRRTDGEESPI